MQSAAETFRQNPKLNVAETITQLAVGEALISLLDESGTPAIVDRALLVPPRSQLGPISAAEREAIIKQSLIYGTYETAVDRESAAEKLQARTVGKLTGGASAPLTPGTPRPLPGGPTASQPTAGGGLMGAIGSMLFGSTGPRGGKRDGLADTMMKTAARSVTTQIVRGLMGSIMGGRRR